MNQKLVIPLYILILYICNVFSFEEYAIFEDEDIYNQALPPKNNTGLTVPGTKWCGPGDTAENYDDLGSKIEVDKCCRDHDHCPEIIESTKKLHDLENPDSFPRLTCKCEQDFLNCLQAVNDTVSESLGRVYFGFRSKCFKNEYPIMVCTKTQGYGTFFDKRCIRYKLDTSKQKIWQYFDIPFYSNSFKRLGF